MILWLLHFSLRIIRHQLIITVVAEQTVTQFRSNCFKRPNFICTTISVEN